jgi:hypothetical protein
MKDSRQLQDDLGYIQKALHTTQTAPSPGGIYNLWAALTLPGFALIEFRPHITGWYWVIAAPVGLVLTAFLAWDYWRHLGQSDMRNASEQAQPWSGMLVAIALSTLLVRSGHVSPAAQGHVILLLLVLGFWLAGVHLEPGLRWVALLMAAGYASLNLLSLQYAWTVLGSFVAIGLVLAGLFGLRGNAKNAD